ncbi:MAG: hypothetical protein K8J31_01905, partial [Anaerolineae bacterium]|nr:hypothetical protein [Anaerolineae bacterium]
MKYRGLIFLALVTLIFFLSYSIPPLYAVNQHTYYPHGLWLSGADYLEYDWYSRTQPAHLAFSLLIAGLNKAGLLAAGSTLIEVLLSLALIGGWWLQIYAVLTDLHEQKFTWPRPLSRLFLASVILGGVIVSWVLWWEMYFWIQTTGFRPRLHFFTLTGGFAGQYIFGGYLQPSEFGILMLLGVGLIHLRRPAWAVILFAIAATFQFSYFIHASIMVLIVVVWLYRTGQRTRTLRSALLYAALTLPTFVYALSFSINQPEAAEA